MSTGVFVVVLCSHRRHLFGKTSIFLLVFFFFLENILRDSPNRVAVSWKEPTEAQEGNADDSPSCRNVGRSTSALICCCCFFGRNVGHSRSRVDVEILTFGVVKVGRLTASWVRCVRRLVDARPTNQGPRNSARCRSA